MSSKIFFSLYIEGYTPIDDKGIPGLPVITKKFPKILTSKGDATEKKYSSSKKVTEIETVVSGTVEL